MKDLTDFFHAERAEILACACCGLLVRQQLETPPAEDYSADEYDPCAIEAVYPQYLDSFRRKEKPYRALLPARAKVLEIGSHYGAFLQTAGEWGWQAEGVDVGRDTARFAQSKGFAVSNCELPDCQFSERGFDGVFIWNCFDQIEDPKPLLTECRRVLRESGVLVLRTPNGFFYSNAQQNLRQEGGKDDKTQLLVTAMGYNNLLGFPYLYGYSTGNLCQLVEPFGFKLEGAIDSELLTLPIKDEPAWVEEQERQVNAEVKSVVRSELGTGREGLAGPWMEVWFRSTER